MSTRRLLAKGATTSRAMAIVLVVLVAVLTAASTAAPVLLDRARSATIARAVENVNPVSRDLGAVIPGLAGDTSADPWAASDAALGRLQDSLPPAIQGVVGTARAQTTAQLGSTRRDGAYPANLITMLADPDVAGEIDVVEGRLPQTPDDAREWEIALSSATAADLDWPVGERRSVDGDAATGSVGAVTLVGRYEARDPRDSDWAHTSGALETVTVMVGDSILTGATGIVAPDAITRFGRGTTAVWWPLAGSRVTADTALEVSQELRRIAAVVQAYPWTKDGDEYDGITLSTASAPAIDAGVARGAATEAALATVVAGPLVVAVVVLALGARLIARRRANAVRLMLARGASRTWIFGTLGAEGAAAGLLGAALGWGAATAVIGWSGLIGIAAGIVFTLVIAVVTPLAAMSLAAATERDDLDGGGGRRRLAIEAAVLVPAIAVIVLTLGRAEPAAGFDVVLAATPVAVAAIATVCALRALPLVLSAAERFGAPRAGLVPLLGPARARRGSPVRTAPVLAVIVGVSVTMFAVVFSSTVTAGIREQAEAEAGSDLHVTSSYITDQQADAVAAIPGVRAVSLVSSGTLVRFEGAGEARVSVYGVDPETFARVQSSRRGGGIDLSPLVDAPRDGTGVPVVVGEDVVRALRGTEGIETERRVPVDVVGQTSRPSPFANVDRFVFVSRDDFAQLTRTTFSGGELFVALDGGAAVAQVRGEIAKLIDARRIVDPAGVLADRSSDPVFTAVIVGVIASGAAVAVLLGLAVVMTLMLGSSGRGRVLALLRTLGYRRRGELALVAWEVAPALLLALPFGVAAGVATGLGVPRALDLTGFIGGRHQPAVVWDAATLGLVIAGFTALAVVVVAIATVVASRMDSAGAVRSVDEEGR